MNKRDLGGDAFERNRVWRKEEKTRGGIGRRLQTKALSMRKGEYDTRSKTQERISDRGQWVAA